MSHAGTVLWLKVASGILVGFGLLGLTGTIPATSQIAEQFLALAFWPGEMESSQSSQGARLLWGINAGLLAGWGVMIWLVTTRLYSKEPAAARTLILAGIFAWFVIDGAGSIFAGAPMNALYNISFLLLFLIPLWRPRSEI